MKNYLLVSLIFLVKTGFSQDTGVFYQTSEKNYVFTFEGNTCRLYQLSEYYKWVSNEWELSAIYHSKSQLDSLGILFSNGDHAISYDYKYFRVCKLKNGKARDRYTYVAKKLDDPSKVCEAINHSYWTALYRETILEVVAAYPHFHEYQYPSHHIDNPGLWESLTFKQSNPEAFKVLATERNKRLKDSLLQTNEWLTALNDSIERNMYTLSPEELTSNLMSRPIDLSAYDEYQEIMLESVARNRPDLFFDLAEALPEKRTYLFDRIYLPAAVKSLKRFDTEAPVKKEFVKYHRRERLKAGLVITGASLLEVGVIGGAITGIVYWIRK